MTDEHVRSGDVPPVAMDAGLDLPEPQRWPKPVGIISIVLGAVGLTCVGCGVFGTLMPVMFVEMMERQYPDGMPPQMSTLNVPVIGSMAFGALLDVLLLVAGISLVMRRAAARPLHLAYAVLGLVSFAIGTYVQVQYQVQLTEWCKQNPATKFAQMQQATGWIGQVIGWTVGIVFGLTWPVFCLIWFGFIKKASDITQGRVEVI